MSPKQQQRTPSRRRPSDRTARQSARQSGSAAERSGPGRLGQSSGTDDFDRLMRANTVDVARQGRAGRRRSPLVGKISFALAVASVAIDASAFAVFMGGEGTFALGVCFVVVFLTLVAAVMGFIAAVGGLGRWYGVGGVLIAFGANPVVLIVVLVFVAPDMATQFGA